MTEGGFIGAGGAVFAKNLVDAIWRYPALADELIEARGDYLPAYQ